MTAETSQEIERREELERLNARQDRIDGFLELQNALHS